MQTGGGATGTTSNVLIGNAGVVLVTLGTDTTLGATPGICPAGARSGDLRYAICHASAGDAIVFDTNGDRERRQSVQRLAADLHGHAWGAAAAIQQNQDIDGGYFGRVNIDGASAYRVFFVDLGTTTLQNLQIQNALAAGGAG